MVMVEAAASTASHVMARSLRVGDVITLRGEDFKITKVGPIKPKTREFMIERVGRPDFFPGKKFPYRPRHATTVLTKRAA